MIKKLSLLFFIILIIQNSCNNKILDLKNEIRENDYSFFEPANLGAFGSETRIIIYANLNECGEWGGHKESFEIFSKENQKFYAKFTRNKIDCNDLVPWPPIETPNQLPEVNKEFKLSKNNIIEINNYLSKLLKSKISERSPGHSGQTFGVIKSDSTLIINVYDNNKENLNNYNILLKSFSIKEINY